jgi:hypothetical protein
MNAFGTVLLISLCGLLGKQLFHFELVVTHVVRKVDGKSRIHFFFCSAIHMGISTHTPHSNRGERTAGQGRELWYFRKSKNVLVDFRLEPAVHVFGTYMYLYVQSKQRQENCSFTL